MYRRRSTLLYCIYLGVILVSWSLRKKITVAWSSKGFVYKALLQATTEVMRYNPCSKRRSCSRIQCQMFDNLSASFLASNAVYHARSKHIELDVHFIRDKVLYIIPEISYLSFIGSNKQTY